MSNNLGLNALIQSAVGPHPKFSPQRTESCCIPEFPPSSSTPPCFPVKSRVNMHSSNYASRSTAQRTAPNLDFDDEARALWEKLNLDPSSRKAGMWNPLDSIWRHPEGGGTIYVGNQTAAENISLLRAHNITHVVNCTFGESKIPNFHAGKLNYITFAVSHWQSFVNSTNASVLAFVAPVFTFIENAIRNGESVLIHCLAGAHRAGTTGVACLIHFAQMNVPTAIVIAKQLRPIIDPIGQLPEFLNRLKRAEDALAEGRA